MFQEIRLSLAVAHAYDNFTAFALAFPIDALSDQAAGGTRGSPCCVRNVGLTLSASKPTPQAGNKRPCPAAQTPPLTLPFTYSKARLPKSELRLTAWMPNPHVKATNRSWQDPQVSSPK